MSTEFKEVWNVKSLRSVCFELQSGKRPKGGVQSIECGIPSLGAEHLNSNGSFKFEKMKFVPKAFADQMHKGVIKPEDVIVVKDGATTGKTSFVDVSFPFNYAVVNEHVFIVRFNDEIFPKFGFYKLFSSCGHKEILSDFRGAAQGGISSGFLDKVNMPVPPKPIQQIIVSKIEELFSELDKGIENLRIAQQQLKTYRQAVLKYAFEGKLTNENIKEGELPDGWKIIELKNLVEKISDGPFGSNLKSLDYVEKGIRVIRLENIGEMQFRNEFKTFITEEKYQTIKGHTVTKGDIIFSSFIIDNIRTVILPDYVNQAVNKADCFLVRCSDSKMNRKYLCFYFSTKAMKNQLEESVHGATRPRINTTQLKSTKIPYCSLKEQQNIVQAIETRLSVADKMEESINQSLQQSEALRQSILKKAFEGRLI